MTATATCLLPPICASPIPHLNTIPLPSPNSASTYWLCKMASTQNVIAIRMTELLGLFFVVVVLVVVAVTVVVV